MKDDWYKEWFASKDYLDVYYHRDDEDANNILNLIFGNIHIEEDAKILDAACGAGRHSIKMAQMGYNVVGFDLSQTLLDIAIRESTRLNLYVDFQRADLRKFESDIQFDLVVNLFTSFGYFKSDEENFTFAKNAYNFIKDKGYYVLDYLNKTFLEKNLVEYSERLIDNKKIKENRSISEGRVVKRITITEDESNSEFLESVKLYSYLNLTERFQEIGFKVNNVFGDYLGNEFTPEESERCIIIFQK